MQVSTHFTIFGLLALTACGAKDNAPDTSPQAVRVQEVRTGPIVQGRRHLATVVPAETVRILAQVPGTIAAIGEPEGATLSRGDLIARIAAPDVAARMARVHAERQRAERERDFVCDQLETDRVLARSGDLPSVQLDRSEKGCASATLAVEAAQAMEREASVAGTRAKEVAPFEGEVLTYRVDVGQTVMPGTPIASYGSVEPRLQLRVVASDLRDIAIGTRVITEVGDGEVVEIGAQAQGPGRLFKVSIALHDPAVLHVGEAITATVVVDERADTTAVPEDAIGEKGDGHYVIVEKDATLHQVSVTPGPHSMGWVAVDPPLPAGTRVVTSAIGGLDLSRPVLAVSL